MDFSHDEAARIEALRELGLLDTKANEAFDRITRLAGQLFGVPIALISLVDQDRQWFKSRVGLLAQQTPREQAFCNYTIQSDVVLVVPNATEDSRFCANPLVLGEPGIRFYAGAPLITREGFRIGSLCVIDIAPRALSLAQQQMLSDLAAMVMVQIELRHAVGRVDHVSGLPNRNQFLDDLKDIEQDHPDGARTAVLVELLEPRQLNDIIRALGPGYAEALIRSATRVCKPILGSDARLYHVGTADLAFITEASDYGWQETLDQLLGELRAPILCNEVPISLLACAGAVPFQLGRTDGRDLLRTALSAAHDARASTLRWTLYDPATDHAHQRSFALLADLREALAGSDQLRLVYQPRVDLGSGRCVGAEALLRWTHPVLGEISPAEFIPLIEHTALARPLTEWVVDTAMAQAGLWARQGLDLAISINISALNLDEEDFAARLGQSMQRYRVSPALVELEFVESALMHSGIRTQRQLDEIARLGVSVAIDDFGTGYSNLSYLQQLPAQIVKLDQCFIRGLQTSPRDQTIVRSMIGMLHDLGYHVVAEGVETQEIYEMITEWGCDEAQGYFLSRPVSAQDLETWLTTNKGCQASWVRTAARRVAPGGGQRSNATGRPSLSLV